MRRTWAGAAVVVVAGALVGTATPAAAETVSGSTQYGPAYPRAEEDCSPPADEPRPRYAVHELSVAVDGVYEVASSTESGFDGVLFVYAAPFDPASPGTGCLAGNDDDGPITASRVTVALQQGVAYDVVQTGFNPGDGGAYTLSVDGPGAVTLSDDTVPPLAGVTGSTVAGPLHDRADAACSTVSSESTAYATHPLTVDASGSYLVRSYAEAFDGYLFVHRAPFDPSAPTVGCLAGNDDDGSSDVSAVTVDLAAGSDYVVVQTSLDAGPAGGYDLTVEGPGVVTLGADDAPRPPTRAGTTDGGPVAARVEEDCTVGGESAPYATVELTVGASGTYDLRSYTDRSGPYDGFLVLYAAPYDPQAPAANCLMANDDLVSVRVSGVEATLEAGRSYVVVQTGFNDQDSGPFTLTVSGPGAVSFGGDVEPVIPEVPVAAILPLAGLAAGGALLLARRRRTA